MVGQGYYVGLLARLQEIFATSPRPVRFHVYSDGRREDFDRFTFTSDREARLEIGADRRIDGIRFHLRDDTMETLSRLAAARLLVPGKSTFGVLAALLTDGYVLYEGEITEFYQYELLEDYTAGNPRFVTLDALDRLGAAAVMASAAAAGGGR